MDSDSGSSSADESHHQRDVNDLSDRDDDGRRGEARQRSLCCRELQLLEFPDKFVLRSVDPVVPDRAFSVSRSDGQILSLSSFDAGDLGSLNPSKVSTVYGVLGTIRFFSGTYVLVITSRKEVGSYFGDIVYLVTGMRFLDYNRGSRFSTSQQKRDEAYFMSLLRTLESTPGLYYSYERDLTLNLQRSCKMIKGTIRKPLWKQADPRFVWNHNMLEELIENKLDAFIIPVIQGSFQSMELTLKDTPFKVTLISRRCNRRLGTRMWRRGANLQGATANFIETEQLVNFNSYISSFLQVRGSIPLLWEQIVDLSYKPRLNIINHDETSRVVERHFHDLSQRYGETLVVDLTDKHGDEGQLSDAFAAEMEKLPHIKYVSFDFHHTRGKGNFDNLQLLYDQIKDNVEKQGYFLINVEENDVVHEQNGIVRSNCIDCLDRTNVTQSYLARKSLNSQLEQIGAFSASECISMYDNIYEMFKILWAEHGDEISLEYAGTPALKGDLVRYGRQTVGGMIKDGVSALSRYYLNNFQDGVRQDALDLVGGHCALSGNLPSPFHLNGFESSYLPVASALIVGGLTVTTFTLNQAGRSAQQYASSVLWAGLTAGVIALMKANGQQFCSRPRLCGLL